MAPPTAPEEAPGPGAHTSPVGSGLRPGPPEATPARPSVGDPPADAGTPARARHLRWGAAFAPPAAGCVEARERRGRYAWQAIAAAGVVVLTGALSLGARPYEAEHRVFSALNGGLPDALQVVLLPVMQAGSLAAVFAAGVLALVARRPRLAGLLVLAGGSAWILAKLVKRVVERGRPEMYFHDVVIRGAVQMGQGFPSGHAAVIAAMATVASPYLGRTGRILVWAVAVLVALARVYIGAHLPLDVVAGFAVGWGFGSLLNLVLGTPTRACCPASRLDCETLE